MIFGDPSLFAIQMDIVKEWSSPPTFLEGVVNVYANGVLVGDVYAYTSSIFQDYIDIVDGVLANPPLVDDEEFSLDVNVVLPKMLRQRHPWYVFDSAVEYESMSDEWWNSVNEDVSKDATFETLIRKRYRLFAMRNDERARLIFFKFDLGDGDYINISSQDFASSISVVIDISYLEKMIGSLVAWYKQIERDSSDLN